MQKNHNKKMSLTMQIMIAMISGGLLGLALNLWFAENSFIQNFIIDGLFNVVGTIFVSSLKMMVVPLVMVSLITGVTSLGDINALGRIGGKALLLYLLTTAVAITLALSIAVTFDPGAGFEMENAQTEFAAGEPPALSKVLIDMVPTNPISAMAEGSMLQIIVFALLFGIAITLTGEKGRHVLNFFNDLNVVIMKMVEILMKLAPFGVFCLIAKTFAGQGLELLAPLAKYFLVMVAALGLHAIGTFSLLLSLVGRLSPWLFFNKIRAILAFAFSTASSNATIPITLRTVESRLGANNSVASFTVPLGATINMDGTAIMQGVATVFIASVYGVDLSMNDYLTVILTATLASIGTAGVPGVGLIMLAMVLGEVGLPTEGIALIIGVDRLLDMIRTAVNVTGDATVTCLIAKSENALDETIFNDPQAGLLENEAEDVDAEQNSLLDNEK
ncbi:dicarboxylate/amino acid:cation symporter [Candidatus Venteria ishoeyi]|uniref:Proton glutamate symport protein n=1 Tax=Candidatus Venteria ishoeyi TaxID=1899563 RepID=A0A1H6FET6_9GAMM|nr:dicarboxylate/amino acid:cation symporter [Candidatus Venteria ishoeyi]SEH07545.1 Proton glutamate symport protein [Candidatus Venteria ishoeyi]